MFPSLRTVLRPISENTLNAALRRLVICPKLRISVTVPERIRNWFVDQFVLKGHQKLLLRMALHQRSFVDVRRGLHEVWRSA
jgi:hypothetical protein